MLFTSPEFILFLAVCLLLYYLLPKKCQWVLLLIASYIFYFIAGAVYPLFIFGTALVTYTAAVVIENHKAKENKYISEHSEEFAERETKKAYRKHGKHVRKWIMLAGLLSMLLLLGVFKYSDFVVENINSLFALFGSEKEFDYPDLILPMGISFYIFQSLGYLLDVYWEKIKAQRNFPKYMLFISFFPQLVQGPISRYSDLSKTLYQKHIFDKKNFTFGIWRILWGYFKKLVIADNLMVVTSYLFDDEYYNGAWVLLGMMLWAVELYADFSGGIDITIGVAQLFGIRVQENFIRPYFSKNITEFWRRWHISMGTWFRDYIFYPMSVSPSMAGFTKFCKNHLGKKAARYFPVWIVTMVTWLATGIWHGASWNFVLWGLANGVIIVITTTMEPLYAKFHNRFPKLADSRCYDAFQIIRTFLLMSLLRMFDCYRDVSMCFSMFISIFKDFDIHALTKEEFSYFELPFPMYGVLLAGTFVMFCVSLAGRSGSVCEKIAKKPFIVQYVLFMGLFLSIVLFGAYGVGFDASQFIYNQF